MSKKLLLADDSATIQRVIEMTFAGEDMQVVTVGDGEEAMSRISSEKPDIVLADIGMPKRSGYEVSAFVKGHAELSKTPVLLLAGAFEPVDDAKAREAKCDGVLVKPFEPQQVIARVRELIGGGTGSPTQPAVSDIKRPAAALTPPRPVELPKREERPPVPDDLMDIGVDDLMPRDLMPPLDDIQVEPETSAAPPPLVMDDSLDDYFDKLDEAFSGIHTSPASAPAAHTPVQRPDRPVLERDLESFDQPLTIETSVHIDNGAGSAPDPFEGLDSLQADDIAVPTLDDLLAGMPPSPTAPEISFDDLEPPPAPVERTTTFVASEPPPPAAPPQPEPIAPVPPQHFAPPEPAHVHREQAVELPPPAPMPPPAEGSGRSIIADAFSALLAAEQGEAGASAMVRLGGNGAAPVVTDAMVDDVARRVIQRLALGSSDRLQAMVREIVSSVAERLVREEIDRIRRNAGSS